MFLPGLAFTVKGAARTAAGNINIVRRVRHFTLVTDMKLIHPKINMGMGRLNGVTEIVNDPADVAYADISHAVVHIQYGHVHGVRRKPIGRLLLIQTMSKTSQTVYPSFGFEPRMRALLFIE